MKKRTNAMWMGLGAVIMLCLSSPAFAVPVDLSIVGPISGNTLGPQSTSNPCIIAGTQCQQPAGFAFNNFVSNGNISSYDESQAYTAQNLRDFAGNVFSVAIDVNTTKEAGEILDAFTLTDTTTNTLLFQCAVGCAGTNIGNLFNNGNGFGDYSLNTFNITGIPGTDVLTFNAVWHNASDGAESFFIVPHVAPVPEPASLLLLGSGLAGLGLLGWKRRNNV